METIKVNVEKIGVEYFATAINRRLSLFSFRKGIDCWFFDTQCSVGIGRAWVKTDEFPLDYFKRLAQSVCFISLGLTEFPEIELTVNTKKLLKIK